SAILQAIAGSDHPSPWRERILAEPAFEQQRIERLLDVGRAGRQLIEKQAERLGPLPQEKAPGGKNPPGPHQTKPPPPHPPGRFGCRAASGTASRLRALPRRPSPTSPSRVPRATGSSVRAPCTG